MITEFFLNIVFNIVSGILNVIPEFTWNVDTSGFAYVKSIISVVGYFLPMGTISVIFSLMLSVLWLRLMISIGRTIWDLLPLV